MAVASFLVEAYAPITPASLKEVVARARHAARTLSREGMRVRHVRAVLVPEDETCFHLFDAPSAAVVGEVARRAGLHHVRIVEAVERKEP